MSNPGFLFAGFAAAWGLAIVYLWLISRRAATVEKQLAALEKQLEDRG